MRSLLPGLLVTAALLNACGDGRQTPRDPSPGGADATVQGPDATTPAEDGAATAPDGGDAPDTEPPSEETWFARCNSLFAVRVAELRREADAGFPLSCDAPLTGPVGRLKENGRALCEAGESPNACRERLYATPPAIGDLQLGCAANADDCMRASFLGRCADGSDACETDEVVCYDGMRPMIYAKAATDGPSDVWWFHLGGEGGPCSGADCWGQYRFGENEFRQAMSTLHPEGPAKGQALQNGVMSGSVAPYKGVNRVRFERCTDAISDNVEEVPVADGVPPELADRYPGEAVATAFSRTTVWHTGFNTFRAGLRAMASTVGRDRDGDGSPDMSSLADARLVVISGASDASMWVSMGADRLRDEIRAIAGDDVEVRLAIDGMFPAMLDGEARFHPEVPANFDMISMPYNETGLCLLDDNQDGLDNEACSDATYREGGNIRRSYDARGVLRDVSCEAAHGDHAAPCYDRNHTLVHHLDLPILILADQEDNTVSNGPPPYAHDLGWAFTDPSLFRRRVLGQAWDIVDHWGTAAREEGAGPGSFVLILPKARRRNEGLAKATHVRFMDDGKMAETMTLCDRDGDRIATASFNQIIAGWLADNLPRTHAIEDAERPEPDGSFWVTGSACRPPE